MDIPSVRVIVHEDTTYVDVVGYTDTIIYDLMKTPPEMVSSRDEIINALQQYATQALKHASIQHGLRRGKQHD